MRSITVLSLVSAVAICQFQFAESIKIKGLLGWLSGSPPARTGPVKTGNFFVTGKINDEDVRIRYDVGDDTVYESEGLYMLARKIHHNDGLSVMVMIADKVDVHNLIPARNSYAVEEGPANSGLSRAEWDQTNNVFTVHSISDDAPKDEDSPPKFSFEFKPENGGLKRKRTPSQ